MESTTVAAALAALAHPTRLAICRMLVRQGPEGMVVGTIGTALKLVAPATLSFHLRELSRAGLVDARPHGRFIYYRADCDTIDAVLEYLAENCRRASADAFSENVDRAPEFVSDDAPVVEAATIKPVIHPKRRAA